MLAGGWYFATEMARILDGAGAPIAPERGAELACGVSAEVRAMTWQVGDLRDPRARPAGGVVWYERSRPPSQIVALVAALAALAVAGRVVLAPIPNVVADAPTSPDRRLRARRRARASRSARWPALVSNFWLGQGPWTPWQMAGWGMVRDARRRPRAGLPGAGVNRRLRSPLACAFAGSPTARCSTSRVMVSYGGEQSLDRYLALSARGIPFNVAHAAGNFVARARRRPGAGADARRYRERFEFDLGGPLRARRGAWRRRWRLRRRAPLRHGATAPPSARQPPRARAPP